MSASIPQPSSSRARTQTRKKLNDDAAYFGPSGSGASKRQAVDKAEGEPRTKRKRIDTAHGNASLNNKRDHEIEARKSLVGVCSVIQSSRVQMSPLVRWNSIGCQCMFSNATSYNFISNRRSILLLFRQKTPLRPHHLPVLTASHLVLPAHQHQHQRSHPPIVQDANRKTSTSADEARVCLKRKQERVHLSWLTGWSCIVCSRPLSRGIFEKLLPLMAERRSTCLLLSCVLSRKRRHPRTDANGSSEFDLSVIQSSSQRIRKRSICLQIF